MGPKLLKAAALIGAMTFLGLRANAAEVILLKKMPTSDIISGPAFHKSKKPAWICQTAKIGEKGNINVASNGVTKIVTGKLVDEPGADEGKSFVKCTLKEYSSEKKRVVNATTEVE